MIKSVSIPLAVIALSFCAESALAATCSFPAGNWEINVKGGDPSVKTVIGNPTSDITQAPGNDGCFRHHQNGSVYWNKDVGAHFVLGAIRGKWSALGWERGFLGYPRTDELATPDGAGRYTHFQGGSVYWHPSTGAFEVHGDIRYHWSTLGWEKSFLGYPLTDETSTPDGIGRFNHFQGGSIYWKPSIGAHSILGAIRGYWAAHGWETNPSLGYPISNELAPAPGSPNRFSDFENGVVYWRQSTGQTSELGAFPLASRDRADLEIEAQNKVNALLAPHASQVYIDRPVQIVSVGDYTRNGVNDVINREIKIRLRIKYRAEFLGIDGLLPDPHTDLEIGLLFAKRGGSGGATDITLTPTRWNAHTHVPAPTSAFISASTINNRLRNDVMNHVIGRTEILGSVPASIKVLSVKITPNGDLRTYIEPL